jgi:hypothetical protein
LFYKVDVYTAAGVGEYVATWNRGAAAGAAGTYANSILSLSDTYGTVTKTANALAARAQITSATKILVYNNY